jgi:hypothetical protein
MSEVLTELAEAREIELYTAFPGKVKTFNSSTEMAVIEPLVRKPGNIEIPVVIAKVLFLRSYWHLNVGEKGLLVFSQFDFSQWWRTDAVGEAPLIGTHDIAYAIFIPGLSSKSTTRTFNSVNETVVPGSKVRLGSAAATEKILKGDSYISGESSFLTSFITWLGKVATAVPALAADAATMQNACTTFLNAGVLSKSSVSKTE